MYCLYLCSNNIASQLGVDSEYILHNHGIYNHKKRVYIFPLNNNNTTINPEVFTKIKNELKRAVNLWMPMVKIDEITFPTDANEHKVYVKVFYRVPNYYFDLNYVY